MRFLTTSALILLACLAVAGQDGGTSSRQTAGVGLIVGAGCVLPMHTPDATVAAVVRKLGGPLKPIPGVKLE